MPIKLLSVVKIKLKISYNQQNYYNYILHFKKCSLRIYVRMMPSTIWLEFPSIAKTALIHCLGLGGFVDLGYSKRIFVGYMGLFGLEIL